jgi:glyoxylase-like metal-dependent hydrolase (beta-lactamase superfamily II)
MRNPRVFTGGSAATNGYLIQAPEGSILIDAPSGIATWLEEIGEKPIALLLTHQHYDHVEDAAAVKEWAACPIHAFAAYSKELTLESMLQSMGWPVDVPPFSVDHVLAGQSTIMVGGAACGVFHVPGHAADSAVFHFPDAGVAYVGDTLFAGGVGRTDLPGGSWQQLLEGIRRDLLTLPGETLIFPGHGGESTIAEEIQSNPFLRH